MQKEELREIDETYKEMYDNLKDAVVDIDDFSTAVSQNIEIAEFFEKILQDFITNYSEEWIDSATQELQANEKWLFKLFAKINDFSHSLGLGIVKLNEFIKVLKQYVDKTEEINDAITSYNAAVDTLGSTPQYETDEDGEITGSETTAYTEAYSNCVKLHNSIEAIDKELVECRSEVDELLQKVSNLLNLEQSDTFGYELEHVSLDEFDTSVDRIDDSKSGFTVTDQEVFDESGNLKSKTYTVFNDADHTIVVKTGTIDYGYINDVDTEIKQYLYPLVEDGSPIETIKQTTQEDVTDENGNKYINYTFMKQFNTMYETVTEKTTVLVSNTDPQVGEVVMADGTKYQYYRNNNNELKCKQFDNVGTLVSDVSVEETYYTLTIKDSKGEVVSQGLYNVNSQIDLVRRNEELAKYNEEFNGVNVIKASNEVDKINWNALNGRLGENLTYTYAKVQANTNNEITN